MNLRQVVETFAGQDKTTRPCPVCATGKLELIDATIVEAKASGYHVVGNKVPQRERECLAAACNSCEFMEEVRI